MGASKLDLTHPFFLASLGRLKDDPDTQEALEEIKRKVEIEHTSCNRVVQKFYGNQKFPHLHDKIWKYDWGKSGASGRKSWRLVVVALNPHREPYELIAGAIYAKKVSEQLPFSELAAIFAGVTAPVPNQSIGEPDNPPQFRQVSNGDGQTRSMCLRCCVSVAVSLETEVIEEAERQHRCESGAELG